MVINMQQFTVAFQTETKTKALHMNILYTHAGTGFSSLSSKLTA